MKPFLYRRPSTLAELHALAAEYGPRARMLCGGTDVLVRLRARRLTPEIVVDLKRVEEISDAVHRTPDGYRIGARAVMATLIDHEGLGQDFPALIEAARVVGSVQIRNRATVAGNICNASPAADTAPALLVYGAIVHVSSVRGSRDVPLDGFFIGPGQTVLATDEIVEWVDLPRKSLPTGSAFGRVTRRYGVDLATINLACDVSKDGAIRLAYGAVAPTPFLARSVQDHRGAVDNPDAVISAVLDEIRPISDVRGGADYRRAMVDIMTRRTLRRALERLAQTPGGAS